MYSDVITCHKHASHTVDVCQTSHDAWICSWRELWRFRRTVPKGHSELSRALHRPPLTCTRFAKHVKSWYRTRGTRCALLQRLNRTVAWARPFPAESAPDRPPIAPHATRLANQACWDRTTRHTRSPHAYAHGDMLKTVVPRLQREIRGLRGTAPKGHFWAGKAGSWVRYMSTHSVKHVTYPYRLRRARWAKLERLNHSVAKVMTFPAFFSWYLAPSIRGGASCIASIHKHIDRVVHTAGYTPMCLSRLCDHLRAQEASSPRTARWTICTAISPTRHIQTMKIRASCSPCPKTPIPKFSGPSDHF